MSETIVNRVAESGLITIDLENFYPVQPVIEFDLKDYLFMGLILREKDFREALKVTDWEKYSGQYVAVTCTADAIIPMWAYMLLASYLQPVARECFYGSADAVTGEIISRNLQALKLDEFTGQRIVIKGCGEKKIGEKIYFEVTKLLKPVAQSIMYGEPCSTVPVYKKARG